MLFFYFQYVLPHICYLFFVVKSASQRVPLIRPEEVWMRLRNATSQKPLNARVSLPVAGDSRDCWRILCFLQAFKMPMDIWNNPRRELPAAEAVEFWQRLLLFLSRSLWQSFRELRFRYGWQNRNSTWILNNNALPSILELSWETLFAKVEGKYKTWPKFRRNF